MKQEYKGLISGRGKPKSWRTSIGWFRTHRAIILSSVCFAISCIERLVNGSMISFNIYATDFKGMFNFTQTEVEVIISGTSLGQGLSVIPGLVFDKFGPRVTCVTGLISTFVFCLLVWSTTIMIDFYKSRSLLVAMYYFGACISIRFCLLATQIVNMANMDPQWRGIVMGIQVAAYSFSFTTWSQIYGNYYIGDGGAASNISGYLLLSLLCFVTIDVLCVLFCKFYNTRPEKTDFDINQPVPEKTIIDDSFSVVTTDMTNNNAPPTPAKIYDSYFEVVRNRAFHIVFWTYVCIVSSGQSMFNNVTVATKSLGLSEYDETIFIAYTAGGVISGVSGGLLTDLMRGKRIYVLEAVGLLSVVSAILYATVGYNIVMFVICTVTTSACSGTLFSLLATELSEQFGIDKFGILWGAMKLVQSIVTFILQYVFGHLYEISIEEDGAIDCTGMVCIQYGYLLFAGVSAVSLILTTVEIVRQVLERRKRVAEYEPLQDSENKQLHWSQ